jgi:hypothetical protein
MTPYALASHVFVCFQDEHVVFLDVRNDRYFALEAAQTRGLETLVDGWPVRRMDEPANNAGEGPSLHESGVIQVLTARGLLTSARAGKDATPVYCDSPSEEIHQDVVVEAPRIGVLALFRFLKAAFAASLALRFLPFEHVIRQAQRRRLHARKLDESGRIVFDARNARHLVAIYTWLRPWVFSAKDACLFEALALGRFLASYGIHPRWVFGVQARPFAAHCWLQQDALVLNDSIDHVGQYTPIMVI